MKKNAPACPASSARLIVPWPLMTITSGVGIDRLHLAQQLDAVGVGQQQVEQHHGGPPRLEQLFARGRRDWRRAPRSRAGAGACSMTIFSQSVTIGSSSTTSTRLRCRRPRLWGYTSSSAHLSR